MTITTPTVDELTFSITNEIQVNAPIETTFNALLEELGPSHRGGDTPIPMVLEPRPGGRWYRDLGDDNGHHWGHVQAIKRPTLLEITGPLFLSQAVLSNLQYRLSELDGGTLITFHHHALGRVPDDVRTGLTDGWAATLERVKATAEAADG